MTDRLWTFENVCLGGAPSRLADVSIGISPGVTAVVGYSGAGKTSLLNLLVGYERPDEGRVTCCIPKTERMPVFWGPQDDGLWPGITIGRHLELVTTDAPREATEELLSDFDLSHVARAFPDRLSRGEASRLAVARAIASDAAVLVLDEPLAHVDPARRPRYWERLMRRSEDRDVSLVFASHEPADVLRYADRVIGLRGGRVVFDGETATLYDAPPDEAAATLLGPVNWLSEADRSRWRIAGPVEPVGVRPERLNLEPAADSSVSVIGSWSGGSVDESELSLETTGEIRRFLHRPARRRLAPGMRVRLTILGLFGLLSVVGCGPGPEGPQLAIASERRFALPSDGALLPAPRDVAIGRNDEKIVLDNAGRVLIYDTAGELVRQWKMPESTAGNPEGACLLADGRICVADTHYHRVVFFDPSGKVVGMFGELGTEPGQFVYPVAITTDPTGNLYVAEYGNNDRVQKFGPDGGFLTAFGSFGTKEGQFQRPSGMVWLDGTLYVVDAFNNRIHVFSDSGESRGLLGKSDLGLHYPYDLSLGPDGRLYVVEYGKNRITVLTTDGDLVARYGTAGTGQGQFATPWGLAVDGAGRIWVADTGNRRLVELIPAASTAAVAANAGGAP